MATFKVTQFFTDTSKNIGWSESWWNNQANAAAVVTAWAPIITARAALCNTNVIITGFRVSNVDKPRDSLFGGTAGTAGTMTLVAKVSTGPWDAMLVRRDIATNDLLGHVFMHSLTTTLFNGRLLNTGNADLTAWLAALVVYQNALIAAVALCRKIVSNTPTYPNLTTLTALRLTEHKVGRPFDQLRGRRAVA